MAAGEGTLGAAASPEASREDEEGTCVPHQQLSPLSDNGFLHRFKQHILSAGEVKADALQKSGRKGTLQSVQHIRTNGFIHGCAAGHWDRQVRRTHVQTPVYQRLLSAHTLQGQTLLFSLLDTLKIGGWQVSRVYVNMILI